MAAAELRYDPKADTATLAADIAGLSRDSVFRAYLRSENATVANGKATFRRSALIGLFKAQFEFHHKLHPMVFVLRQFFYHDILRGRAQAVFAENFTNLLFFAFWHAFHLFVFPGKF